jgi:hypothetical protein
MTDATAEDGALFGVTDARPARPGEVAATFRRLVDQALQDGKLVDEDAALVAGVAVLAEALDTAHRVGGMKGGYLAAQAFPPYQRGLHALRLPVELTAATPPAPAAAAGNGQDELTEFLRDLGTAE